MRTLFGAPEATVLAGTLVVVAILALLVAAAVARNPLLLRLALRNLPRRPGFAALITLGLTLGTVILSTAFTTGDTMSASIRSVVAGALGSADDVVFVPRADRQNGFDVASEVANGTLLTAFSTYFPEAEAQPVTDVLGGDSSVTAVVPAALEQVAISSAAQQFQADVAILGVPVEAADGGQLLRALDGTPLPLAKLGPGEVYVNTEAASALGLAAGDTTHLYGLGSSQSDLPMTVRAVARVGDLGGGQAAVFVALPRLQQLTGHDGEVNQVLILNAGSAAQRLNSSWPIVVRLRSALLDPAAASRLFRLFAAPAARQSIATAAEHAPGTQGDKLHALLATLNADGPSPEFAALVQDPEVLQRLTSAVPGVGGPRGAGPVRQAAGERFTVLDVQQMAQEQADFWGSAFTDLFVVLGLFSLASGLLLILLVFSLLALERRAELGILRALGGTRRDVVLLLAVEGALYSIISALFGLAGGLILAYTLIGFASGLVAQYGFRLDATVQPSSLAVSYGLGVILTFVTVTVTAWRSSRFSITSAIRDLPDPVGGLPGARSLLASIGTLAIALGFIWLGLHRLSATAYAAGLGLAIAGSALTARWLLRRLGAPGPERVVFSLAGVALIVWWLLPTDWLRGLHLPTPPPTIDTGFLSGLSVLLGAVWLIAYNVGFLRAIRGRAPLWRVSVAYVAAHRFRTGLTLCMFALVVLSLSLASVLLTATTSAYGDPDAATGGWDIHASGQGAPRDLRPELAGGPASPDQFTAIGATGTLPANAIQLDGDSAATWQPATLTTVDQGFVTGTSSPLTAATGDPRSTWQQLIQQPGTAIVGAALLASGTSGFRLEDQEGNGFHPVTMWVHDQRGTAKAVRLTVIGVADARGPFASAVLVGGPTLADWAPPQQATYYFTVAPGAEVGQAAAAITLAEPDLQATPIREDLRLVEGVRGLLQLILNGFMGIGLLAGVAALGTISMRTVVERRAQIGVLRSLGFASRMVALGLLVESGIVALLGSVIGVAVGLFVALGSVTFLGRQHPELQFSVAWDQLALIIIAAVFASLLMTLLPAGQAARLSPAQALREA